MCCKWLTSTFCNMSSLRYVFSGSGKMYPIPPSRDATGRIFSFYTKKSWWALPNIVRCLLSEPAGNFLSTEFSGWDLQRTRKNVFMCCPKWKSPRLINLWPGICISKQRLSWNLKFYLQSCPWTLVDTCTALCFSLDRKSWIPFECCRWGTLLRKPQLLWSPIILNKYNFVESLLSFPLTLLTRDKVLYSSWKRSKDMDLYTSATSIMLFRQNIWWM